MVIIATAQMGAGTFEAKFIPLSKINFIEKIYVLRKTPGPAIDKVNYINIPSFIRFKLIYSLVAPFILAYYCKKTKSEFIISYHFIPHAIYAFIASKLTGIPFIFCQTGLLIQSFSKIFLFRGLIIRILKNARYINVPGSKSKSFWSKQGINEKKINILHSTINPDEFIQSETDKEYDFIYVGRLAEEKRLDIAVKAFIEIHKEGYQSNFIFVGDGPEKSKLKNIFKYNNLNKQVKFVGFQKDVNYYLNKSKIFILSSRSEGLPTAVMQAMACKLLVIVSEVGNLSDMVIHNENGFIYPFNNILQLKNNMRNCLENYEDMTKVRENAREMIFNNHSYAFAINKWSELLIRVS